MPLLNDELVYDSWIGEQPVVREYVGKIVCARNDVCRLVSLLEVESENLNESGAIH